MKPSAAPGRTVPSIVGIGAATVALATGLAACGGSGGTTTGASKGTSRDIAVTITAANGCTANTLTAPAGALTFAVSNKDATAVSELELQSGERIVGEKENLPPGFSGNFSVNVPAGKYTLYCPGGRQENTSFTVTGQETGGTADASTDALLQQGVTQYGAYVTSQVGYLVSTSEALSAAIQSGNLAAAQQAYMKARPYYEKIEPVAESFTIGSNNLDNDIDARIDDVPPSQFEGFHRIEMGLFQAKSVAGLSTYATGLVANVQKLQTLTKGLTYKPFELANGAQDLLDEVASSKITGEEERYSHIDLLDFQANDEGAEQAFADIQPALQKIDPALTSQIATGFTALDAKVDTYRSGSNASGFELYTQLTDSDKQALAAAVKAVQEPLSQVGSKVANA